MHVILNGARPRPAFRMQGVVGRVEGREPWAHGSVVVPFIVVAKTIILVDRMMKIRSS